jgi:integrase
MANRVKTDYPGVFHREATRVGGSGTERIYYVVYRKNGKLHEEKAGRQYADDMTPARAAGIRAELIEGKRLTRKEAREKAEAERKARADKWTVDRIWKAYKGGRRPGKALKTDEGRYDNYLKDPFGGKEPSEIVLLDVERLKRNLLKIKKPQTVVHVLNLFTWIINHGVRHGWCGPLPFQIQKPRVDNEKTEDLTADQLKKLLETIDKDSNATARAFLKMVLFTGMRRSELFKLRWQDVDFHRSVIHIRDPKGGASQKIPLSDAARKVLESHPRTRSQYVFPGKDGGQRVEIRKPVNRIKKAAGLPEDFRPLHGLRHVYASMLASSGQVDMYHLQRLLTHKNPKMTQRYAHLRDDALRRASGVAGDIIGQLTGESKRDQNTAKTA